MVLALEDVGDDAVLHGDCLAGGRRERAARAAPYREPSAHRAVGVQLQKGPIDGRRSAATQT